MRKAGNPACTVQGQSRETFSKMRQRTTVLLFSWFGAELAQLCTAQEQAEQLQYSLAKLAEQRGAAWPGAAAAARLYGRLNSSSTVTVQPHCRRQFHFSVGTPFELHDKEVCNIACEPNVPPSHELLRYKSSNWQRWRIASLIIQQIQIKK